MRKLKSAWKFIRALAKRHAPTLLVIKAISWALFVATGAALTWLWSPLTANEIAHITWISIVVSYIPFSSWLIWQGVCYLKNRKRK